MTLKQAAKQYKKQLFSRLNKAKLGKSRNDTTWIGDIADHIHLCNKILDNKVTEGNSLETTLWRMDTASRDNVPGYIWRYT